jgi:flagellar basal-body rod modification protein FlgD
MNPQKDTDFIAQMAQFSALEQSKALSTTVEELSTRQQFSEAASLLGRTVCLSANDALVQGVVSAVNIDSGTPALVVNGQSYTLSQVLSVSETLPEQ